MPKHVKLEPGDVFEMPLADGRLGYGVIVLGGGVPYVIILRALHQKRPTLAEIATDEIVLVGQTMDSLIYHGQWSVVFRGYPIPAGVPFPNWKVRVDGRLVTTDFTGQNVLGATTSEESEALDFKSSRAPIAFQNALEALHGLQAWRDDYDRLTPAYAAKRVTRP